jgi:hypothetical protein
LRGALEPGQLALQAAGVVLERALAVGARVQLDHVGAEPRGRLDRARLGLDEERHADARGLQ